MTNKELICIYGPTASGKTSLSVDIAKALNTEVISCDSRQFFKEMQIGTARPFNEELEEIPHHFLGNLSITEEYSAGKFESDALSLLDSLFKKHDQVIMVGGSGLYGQAVTEGIDDFQLKPEIRAYWRSVFDKEGIDRLVAEVTEIDPKSLNIIDIKNPRRLLKVIEIYHSTGHKFSEWEKKPVKRPFNISKYAIEIDREHLYERINKRVDLMFELGLENEVKNLLPYQSTQAFNTVGYKEFLPYFEHNISLEEVKEEIKKNSRRYAKRQITWLKREKNIRFLSKNSIQKEVLKTS